MKRFGDFTALAGVDFQVAEATVVGLLGPNGAGKTTAIRILTTLLRLDGGRATVAGHDVMREPQLVRSVIGLTGQYAAVDDDLTGRENLVLVGRLSRMAKQGAHDRAALLLDVFELTDAADRPLRTSWGSRTTSCPATVARPPSGRSNVVRMRIAVVLPAPLGPSNPTTVASATSKSTPASAVKSPKRLTSPSARTPPTDLSGTNAEPNT